MVFDLVKATEEHLCKPQFRGQSDDCHLYPSEASVVIKDKFGDTVVHGGCMRASYFRCSGEVGTPLTARSYGIFELGNTVEDMLVNDWKEMGIYVANSVRFQNLEYNISGELDVVLRDPETGLLFGTEIKSFYGYFASTEIFGNKSKVGKPKMNNLLQTLIYASEFKNQLDHFKLFYEDRGDGTKKCFDVRIVPEEIKDGAIVHYPKVNDEVIRSFTIEDMYQRFSALNNYIVSGSTPERDYELFYTNERIEKDHENGKISDSKYNKFKKVYKNGTTKFVERDRPGDWQCSYCKFKDLCWK
jgi:CRISPR/Cas system-associated exonuclease Cas4 (RecB family)